MTGLPRHPPYSRNRSDGADVLVIGAGMAGVTAARELARSGFAVTVVEGGNRVGGRLRTIHDFGPQPIEAGAEFIHGDGAAGLSTRPCPLVRDTMLSLGGSARWLPTSLLHPGTWHASTILRSIARFGSPDLSAREFLERRRGGEGKAGSGRHRSAAVGRSGNEILADRRNRRSGLPQRSPRRSRGTEVSLVLTRVD